MTGRVVWLTLDTMAPTNPYDGQGPVHPGPEPMFPHAEAAAAITAIQTLLGQFMALSNTRDSAAGEMLASGGPDGIRPSGLSIAAFVARNDELSNQLQARWRASSLELDADWLRTAINDANTRHDQWQTQLDYHLQWTAANPGVDPRSVNVPV